jgi:hypothetical protein
VSERVEGSAVNELARASTMSGLSHRRGTMFKTYRYNEKFHVGDDGSSPDSVSTLVPMLVGGLGLIVAGMIAVGIFVG